MRVVTICCIRNERDILEAFVRHTAVFCDKLIILDHGSSDESPEILDELKREGLPLHLVSDPTLGHVEVEQVSRLVHLAAHDFSADWIMALDADEFLAGVDPRGAFLPPPVDGETPCVKLRSRNYHPQPEDDPGVLNPVERIVHRLDREPWQAEDWPQFKTIVPGWLARRQGGAFVQGKHRFLIDGREAPHRVIETGWLAHFSLRSPGQYAIKLASKQLLEVRHLAALGVESSFYGPHYDMLRDSYSAFAENLHGLRVSYQPDETNGTAMVRDPIRYCGGALRYTPGNAGPDGLIRDLLDLCERFARPAVECEGAQPPRLSIEVASHPAADGTGAEHFAAAFACFQTVRLPLDCPAATTELHLRLSSPPGMIEIKRIILKYREGPDDVRIFGVEEMKRMLRVVSGAASIVAFNTHRLLVSTDAALLVFAGWKGGHPAPPVEARIELRYESRFLAPVVLAPHVLDAFTSAHNELAQSRVRLHLLRDELADSQAQLDLLRPEAASHRVLRNRTIYHAGSVIDFGERGNALLFQGDGWSVPEAWGAWTDGPRATLQLRFPSPPDRDMCLSLLARGLIVPAQPEMTVHVSVNGAPIETLALRSTDFSPIRLTIPASHFHDDACEIAFDIPNPLRPEEDGSAPDARRLGLAVARMDLQWKQSEASAPIAMSRKQNSLAWRLRQLIFRSV